MCAPRRGRRAGGEDADAEEATESEAEAVGQQAVRHKRGSKQLLRKISDNGTDCSATGAAVHLSR